MAQVTNMLSLDALAAARQVIGNSTPEYLAALRFLLSTISVSHEAITTVHEGMMRAWTQAEAIRQTPPLDEAMDREFDYYGERCTLRKLMNVGVDDVKGIVSGQGSTIVQCVEQGNKTMTMVGVIIANRVTNANRPVVVIVNDNVCNVDEVRAKMHSVLKHFGIMVACCGTAKDARMTFTENKDDFLSGRLVIIVAAHQHHLRRFFEPYISDMRTMANGILLLDEADALWSENIAESGNARAATEREKAIYRILDIDRGTGAFHGRFSSIVHVSATHMATIWWHVSWTVPFTSVSSRIEDLADKGYTPYSDIVPFKRNGVDAYLSNTLTFDEKMRSPQLAAMLQEFEASEQPYRMCLIACTAFKNREDNNMRVVTRKVLEHSPSSVVLVSTADGVSVYDASSVARTHNAIDKASVAMTASGARMTIQDVIQHLADRPGGGPIVVIGYQAFMRGTSLRAGPYVITHMVVIPTGGLSTANLEQVAMRCGGRTRVQRAQNGFSNVTVLCDRDDLEIIHVLYEATHAILQRLGTGLREDLQRGLDDSTFDARFRPVIESVRKHMIRGMREDSLIQKIKVASPPPSPPKRDRAAMTGSVEQRLDLQVFPAEDEIFLDKGGVILSYASSHETALHRAAPDAQVTTRIMFVSQPEVVRRFADAFAGTGRGAAGTDVIKVLKDAQHMLVKGLKAVAKITGGRGDINNRKCNLNPTHFGRLSNDPQRACNEAYKALYTYDPVANRVVAVLRLVPHDALDLPMIYHKLEFGRRGEVTAVPMLVTEAAPEDEAGPSTRRQRVEAPTVNFDKAHLQDWQRVLIQMCRVADADGCVTLEQIRRDPVCARCLETNNRQHLNKIVRDGYAEHISTGSGRYRVMRAGTTLVEKLLEMRS